MGFDITRRKLIGGIGLLVAAPAIVRASSIMPVKSLAHLEGDFITALSNVEAPGKWYVVREAIKTSQWRQLHENVYPRGMTFKSVYMPDSFMPDAPTCERLLAFNSPTAAGESAA